MNRRDFIIRTGRLFGGLAFAWGAGIFFHNRQYAEKKVVELKDGTKKLSEDNSLLSVVRGDDAYEITKKAVELLGGMQKFIKRGDIVSIKPNIGWDRTEEQAANTNPNVIKALIELCFDAGAKEVRVGDVPCVEPNRSYQRSGIAKVAKETGAKLIMPEERFMKEMNLKGEFVKNWLVFVPMIDVDKIINVPIVKHHSLTLTTIGMKNWFGIVSGPRNQLHQHAHEAIVDLAKFVNPVLTIIDAYRVLVKSGPQGGSLAFVKLKKTIASSTNPVAADAFGAKLLDLDPLQLRFIQLAQKAGLGSAEWTEVTEDTIE